MQDKCNWRRIRGTGDISGFDEALDFTWVALDVFRCFNWASEVVCRPDGSINRQDESCRLRPNGATTQPFGYSKSPARARREMKDRDKQIKTWNVTFAFMRHFYQPPRENPWLETVEFQDSAYPYHDWNERITAECYAPNGASRILDGDGRIAQIVNNYSQDQLQLRPDAALVAGTAGRTRTRRFLTADRESRTNSPATARPSRRPTTT